MFNKLVDNYKRHDYELDSIILINNLSPITLIANVTLKNQLEVAHSASYLQAYMAHFAERKKPTQMH